MARRSLAATVLAAALPLALTGYVVGLGYSLDRTLASDALPGYVVTVAALGVVLALAWHRGAVVTAVGGVLVSLALPVWRPLSLTRVSGGPAPGVHMLTNVLFVLVALVVFALGVEYALRNPGAVRNTLTPHAKRAGAAGGATHALAVAVAAMTFGHVGPGAAPGSLVVAGLWVLGGAFLVGAAAGVLFARFRLVAPALAVVALFAWAVATTPPDPSPARAMTMFFAYSMLWALPLLVALAAGALEAGARRLAARARSAAAG